MVLFFVMILGVYFRILCGGGRRKLMAGGGIKVFLFGFEALMCVVLMRTMSGQRLIAFFV